MKKLILSVLVLLLWIGCQKQHPINVRIDPAMEEADPRTIAVLPFLSRLHDAEDPDRIGPATMEQILNAEIDKRSDYEFLSPGTVKYAVEMEKLDAQYEEFLSTYAKEETETDKSFLAQLANALKCDAFLIGVVDLWQKDEADAQENATPATYVGATLSIVSKDGNTLLFRATDEDYMEGARTEKEGRSLVTGSSGAVRSDLGAKVHRAPPFEEVAVKVMEALVASIPAR